MEQGTEVSLVVVDGADASEPVMLAALLKDESALLLVIVHELEE